MYAILTLLVACTSHLVTMGGDEPDALTDTGENEDASVVVDTRDDAAADAVDLTRWNGTRRFYYDASELGYYCDETIAEQGLEIPAGTGMRALLQETCPACSHLYEAFEDREEACGWIELAELGWRGIELQGDRARVHIWYADDGDLVELTVAQATFDGQFLHYDYTFLAWGGLDVRVTGTFAFATQDARR